jgi:hypothetical protein
MSRILVALLAGVVGGVVGALFVAPLLVNQRVDAPPPTPAEKLAAAAQLFSEAISAQPTESVPVSSAPAPEQLAALESLQEHVRDQYGLDCGNASRYLLDEGLFSSDIIEIRDWSFTLEHTDRLGPADEANGIDYRSTWRMSGIQRIASDRPSSEWGQWSDLSDLVKVERQHGRWKVSWLFKKKPSHSCSRLQEIASRE